MVVSSNAADQAVPALELANVVAGYGPTEVLHDVSVVLQGGTFTALLGPNGAGKSTLMKVASGLLRPTSGAIRMDGRDVGEQPAEVRAADGLCHIPEGRAVYRHLTVAENLAMQSYGVKDAAAKERALEAFPILHARANQVAGTLSGGEQQMLALAAAHIRNPAVVLVDEPSLGLAPIITDAVFSFLESLRGGSAAVLIADQFANKLLQIADQAYVMVRGEILYEGSPDGVDTDALMSGRATQSLPVN